MRPLCAAIRFLTILPLPGTCGTDAADLAPSVWFFPVVGLLIGACVAAIAFALGLVFSALLAAAFVVVLLIAVSGGLHMDGLSDTADGFLSSRPRERILEIMKDSHAGAMGIIAIVSVMLLKVAALGELPRGELWRAALLMPLAGRSMMVLAIALLPYARPEGGLGTAFCAARSLRPAFFALMVLAVAGWLAAGVAGLIAAASALGVTLLFSLWSHRKIGGATGDTFGATCELGELAVAVGLAAAHAAHLLPQGAV